MLPNSYVKRFIKSNHHKYRETDVTRVTAQSADGFDRDEPCPISDLLYLEANPCVVANQVSLQSLVGAQSVVFKTT
jgi:hypothetical protein